MRSHSNFAEYTPLALLLIAFVESNDGSKVLVHSLGALLLLGRTLHAYGLSNAVIVFRVTGMVFTIASISISSAYLLLN